MCEVISEGPTNLIGYRRLNKAMLTMVDSW